MKFEKTLLYILVSRGNIEVKTVIIYLLCTGIRSVRVLLGTCLFWMTPEHQMCLVGRVGLYYVSQLLCMQCPFHITSPPPPAIHPLSTCRPPMVHPWSTHGPQSTHHATCPIVHPPWCTCCAPIVHP